ncbi:MAG: helix-turn-helix domain-containing protein [Treponema sp.]|jgi:transcriptional regulator with XRE-family HTH domain|nr:helix-turn-helix domain-containing protein [Treponema sp.]
MTHFQEIFIENLRFWRKKRGLSQLKLSELVNISPNYLNAVENGKNFPSPEVIQYISDTLEILPYQLFLEHPIESIPPGANSIIPNLLGIKQKVVKEIDNLIKQYQNET